MSSLIYRVNVHFLFVHFPRKHYHNLSSFTEIRFSFIQIKGKMDIQAIYLKYEKDFMNRTILTLFRLHVQHTFDSARDSSVRANGETVNSLGQFVRNSDGKRLSSGHPLRQRKWVSASFGACLWDKRNG